MKSTSLMKKLLLLLVLASFVLGACQSAATPDAASAEPTAEAAAPTAPQAASATQPAATQDTTAAPTTAASAVDFPASGQMPGCTVTSIMNEPDPQIISVLGDVTENDRIWGSTEAEVTFIEYGDFQ